METALITRAIKDAYESVTVTAVLPYMGYMRKDRKDEPRVPISAKYICDMLKVAGVDRLVTVDLHASQEQGFSDGPFDTLPGSHALLPSIKLLDLKEPIIVSPDIGGGINASDFAPTLGTLQSALVLVEKLGANRITTAITHGIFVDDALQRLTDSPIEKFIK